MFHPNGVSTAAVEPQPALTEKWQRETVRSLQVLLSEGSVLSLWLRNYPWNRTDINSYAFYSTFEIQLNDIGALADEAAERIRQYGACVLATLEAFIQVRLREAPGIYPDARTLAIKLITHHTAIVRCMGEDIKTTGAPSGDVNSGDLVNCLVQYENMVWMLWLCLEMQPAVSE